MSASSVCPFLGLSLPVGTHLGSCCLLLVHLTALLLSANTHRSGQNESERSGHRGRLHYVLTFLLCEANKVLMVCVDVGQLDVNQ